jgi:uncharacterized protein
MIARKKRSAMACQHWRIWSLGLVSLFILAACGGLASPPRPGPVIPLSVGGRTVSVEVAATNPQRERGLMGRTSIPDNEGMLFVYKEDQPGLWYWMKDTPTPLSIAFIGSDKRIINMADMQPMDDKTHYTTAAPCRYVLELNAGWFARHGVKPGDQVEFTLPPDLNVD